ncbi:hypothetical protein MTX26_12845 [Bradyrhizobium sp. ISRA443]|uniref:hypothetical protein n=1 Tax=unclassified Bradyrhizobium TaxID=2631580 RepID=UPI002478BED7|nr:MULTISPECIES: hypothetical protein [unclassified Bradyrhizobium]WGR91399.1 hypothetical protein MTX20_23310 [Bradyrhizobium sp. ISRA435]WGS01645.1 hypothetical protein MTX23_12855 [Bradyrhizobium sp. ISRA436]WGS08531.1 hypothetical protein MTX18_12845 [Bradyrhizobium sp. ISRA437]WGS15419.1 hypothetical protein MTX26_12845 [Bradyrhizobium sp. ISRA443]
MTIFLILAPYGVLAVLSLLTSATVSMFCAALICLAVIVLDVARGRTIKILTVGSVTVFTAIGCYLTFVDATLSNNAVSFAVNAGLLSVALLSIVFRHPFTLQYAREMVDAETMQHPGFVHTNYLLTWAWTGAFLLMAIGDMAVLYVPGLPLWSGLLIAFAARNSAIYFTKWYPEYRKARYGAPPANALPSP